MPSSPEALETVDLLYRAAVEPELWPEALDKLAHAVGCVGTAMIPITPNDTTGLVVSPGLREPNVEYEREWWQIDSRVGRIHARGLSRGVCCEAELFTDAEIARDPLRQEFCRDWALGAFAAQLAEPWPGHVVAFSVQRALKTGHFERDELERLAFLGRHAARALTVSMRLTAAETITSGLSGILDRFDGGVFVLDQQLQVVLMNATAERLLGDGLSVRRRRLRTAASQMQAALDRLSDAARRQAMAGAELGPIALPRPSGRRPLLVQAMPICSQQALNGSEAGMLGFNAVLLLVIDPDRPDDVPAKLLRLFGLTPAEARLAALIGAGYRRAEAADMLGITEGTARDTLKHAYSKLDISRQSQLVRLVSRLAAVGK